MKPRERAYRARTIEIAVVRKIVGGERGRGLAQNDVLEPGGNNALILATLEFLRGKKRG